MRITSKSEAIDPTSAAVDRHAPTQHKRRRRKFRRLSIAALGIAAIVGGIGGTIASSFDSTPLQRQQLSPQAAAVFQHGDERAFGRNLLQVPELHHPVNILLLGIKTNLSDLKHSDGSQRKHVGYDAEIDSLDGLSDTMMLLRFDPVAGRIVVLGIPRDTQITRDKYGTEKINAVDHESGVAAAAQEVSKVLNGVEIDRYVRVNNIGIEKLIDSLGGLTVTVPKDVKYQDDSQHFYVNLKAGNQHLDGKHLLGYIRYRHDTYGDIGRMQRQQIVMKSAMEQWVNPGNLTRVTELFDILKSHVDTNLSTEEMLALGGFAVQADKSKTQMLLMPGDYNGDGKHGVSYWLADSPGIQNMMARYFNRGTLAVEPVNAEHLRINIEDTSYYPDRTRRLIAKLNKAGYQNIHLDPSPKIKADLAKTEIIAQNGDDRLAASLSQVLGLGEVKVETSGHLYSQVTIKVGRDLP